MEEICMGLKELYYSWEDGWYKLLDKIDAKIPIYKVIEPIDKIVPSFALFLIVVALLVVWGALTLLAFPAGSVFSVQVLDAEDNPLPNASVRAFLDGEEVFSDATNEFGETKQQLFALGTVLEVVVSKEGYDEYSESVALESAAFKKRVYLDEIRLREVTILLKDEYNQPIREPVTLYFTCRNTSVQAPSSITVSNGQATIIEPSNCNGLIVSLEADNYNSVNSLEITQGTQTIYLQAIASDEGTVNVELRFNGQLISEMETVYLYKDNGVDGSGPIDSQTTANGIASFSRAPGTYFVKTGGTGRFGAAQSSVFTLAAGQEQTISLELEENIVGNVKLKIVNKNSNAAIADATVTLKIGAQDAVPSRETDSNGLVSFAVTQDVEFTAVIDHEDYCFTTVKVSIGDAVQTLKIEPYTPACGGTLKVKVLDQGGKLIKNAAVSLHNEDGFSLGFRNRTTDVNGIAKFTGVKSGNYKAFAFKGSSSGWSEIEHFIERAADKTILTVVLTVPDGTIRVRVLDADGNPLQFAQVAFIEVVDNKPVGGGALPVEDTNGSVELTTRADKKVYIIASKDGYTNYTSLVYPVIPSTVQEITAVLEKEIISGEIEIRFLGMVNNAGRVVSVLAPGSRYKARFQLRVPVNKSYDSIGLHVRTGSHDIMELDKIVLKELNVPGRATVVKATSFNPDNGYSTDAEFVTSDEAKWANIQWRSFVSGLINVEAEVRVKETAKVDDELTLYYRVWGEEDGGFVRDPTDASLGDTAGVDESLYANTHKQIFQVGTETVCDEQFCFSASILDLTENLAESVSEAYAAKIFKEYRLNFSILNNSEFETDSYIGAEVRIKNENEGILLTDYSVYGAQAAAVTGSVYGSETEWISVGDLHPNVSVSGAFNFTPQQTGLAPLIIEIRSGQRIRFSKTISTNVSAHKRFDVVVIPELLPSGIENKATVIVKEQPSDLEVADAAVKVKDKFGDVIAEKTTNTKGTAILTLPALHPGEKLFLRVEKFDFEVFERELNVDEKIVSIKPERLGLALNAKTKHEAEKSFTVENRTNFDIVITDLRLDGRFRGLLDEERIENWLFGFEGETIKAGEEREYSLKAFLSEAGQRIVEAKTLQGELLVSFSAYQSIWNFSLPVTISVGLGGEVDDPTCFNITRKEWKGFTEGNPVEIEFEVQNNCSAEGTPVSLRDIEAKIQWQGNSIGEFELRTEQAAIELRSGYFRRFASQLLPGESVSVIVSFSPGAGVDGVAKAEILFQASNPTDTKTQVLSDRLAVEITAVNLIDCVYVDKDVLIIDPLKEDSFGIETLGCGPRTDIKIESELTVTPEKLVMQNKDKKEVTVFAERNMPGQYPVRIFAKAADQVEEKLIKTVRVRILSGKCLELSKYEFEVFDNPEDPFDGYDTAEIINRCYDKPVTITVKWDEHNWGDAIAKGLIIGLVMGLAGGVAAIGQDRTFMTGAEKVAAGASATSVSELEKQRTQNEELLQRLKDQEEAAETSEAEQQKLQEQISSLEQANESLATAIQDVQAGEEEALIRYDAQRAVNRALAVDYIQRADGGITPTQPEPDEWIYWMDAQGTLWKSSITVPDYRELADFPPSPPRGAFVLAAAGGGFGNVLGGAMQGAIGSMIGGIGTAVMGPPSFLSWGLQGAIMGTLWAYSQQDEGSFSFTEILLDLDGYDVGLYMPGAAMEEGSIIEVPSEDIKAQLLDEYYTEPRPDNPRLSIEYAKVGFLNTTGVEQPDLATPLYRVFKVGGERVEYVTEYEFDEEKMPDSIEEESREEYKQEFRLQFNAFNPLEVEREAGPIPNCKLGNIVGVTGESAVPKVLLKWDWSSIDSDACDEGNPDYIYCDATQFSIEVLQKVNELQQFIDQHKPFNCPSPGTATAVKEQQMVTTAYDVGLTKIQAMKAGADANVLITVESNNNKRMDVDATINLKDSDTGALVKSCTRPFELVSKTTESCLFTSIPAGVYDVEATIVPDLCDGCENNDEENDSIEAQLIMGELGIEECEPYTTLRFKQFLEATENAGNATWSQQEKEEILKLLTFNAHLIKDAYTNDFRQDFHEFCVHKSFFDCPNYYLEEDGLGEYFSSVDGFLFDYSQAPHAPVDAGKFEVKLDIEFDNENWDFFSGGELDATIRVRMSQLSTPEPNSPFYYLPFDGTIGIDSANGRQGYGVNFRQTSEETIKINNDPVQMVVTTNIAASTPVFGGWVNAGFNDSFRRLNIDRRGILLDVQAGSDETNIVLSPSYATPIMMNVNFNQGEEAYGFYSVEIDNSPQTAFTKMIPWNGVGVNCRDFEDSPMLDAWQDTWDIHGGITGNIRCARGTDIQDYGVEWCNPIRSGAVFLQSVVFTPQGTSSLMQRSTYSNDMVLIGTDNSGSQIALNGVPGMEFNSYGTSSIESVEDVFNLVEAGLVCLVGADNRISNQFFWNPKVVLEEMSQQRSQAEAECIRAS